MEKRSVLEVLPEDRTPTTEKQAQTPPRTTDRLVEALALSGPPSTPPVPPAPAS